MTRTPLAVALLVVVSFVSAAPVPKAKPATGFFPHTVGTKWEYIVGGDEKKVRTEEVTEREEKDGVVTFKVEATTDKAKSWRRYERKDGAYQLVASKFCEYSPAQFILRDDMKAGDSWDQKWMCHYQQKNTKIVTSETESVVVGKPEEITTKAGKFTAVPVTRTNTVNDTFSTVSWYADGVGLVRKTSKHPSEQELELTSFTPGKK